MNYPVASERSIGKEMEFKGKKYKIVGMQDAIAAKPELLLFSAGGSTSLNGAKICGSRHHCN